MLSFRISKCISVFINALWQILQVLDELLPKATGREAMIEKKRVRAEKKRDRELSPEIKESVLMGGG